MKRNRISGTPTGYAYMNDVDIELLVGRRKRRRLLAIIAMYVPAGLAIVNILGYYTLPRDESWLSFDYVFWWTAATFCFWILIYPLPNINLICDIRKGIALVSRVVVVRMEEELKPEDDDAAGDGVAEGCTEDGGATTRYLFETEDGLTLRLNIKETDFDDIKNDGCLFFHYAPKTRILLGLHIGRSDKYFNIEKTN